MGDMGEIFDGMRRRSEEKRASNRENSAQILAQYGIEFESKNIGAHLIVKHAGKIVDFWPGTGKWIVRDGKQGRGVSRLLKLLEVDKEGKQ